MRDTSFDTISGIMIYFMIFRHCFMGTTLDSTFLGGCLFFYPLMFYMGWFFFKGGCFSHDTSLTTTLDKGIRRLLVPYLCFSIIAICLEALLHGIFEGAIGAKKVFLDIPVYLKREGAVICNAPLWFLLSLFFVRVFYAFFIRIRIPVYIVSLLSLLGSFLLYRADLPIGLYFENILLGLFFYSVGSLLNKKQYNSSLFYASCGYYLTFLLFAFFTQGIVCEFRINTFIPYFPTILFSISGCIVANNLFVRFPSLHNEHFASVGRNSMPYFTTHFIIIGSLHYLNDRSFHLPEGVLFASTFVIVFALLPLIAELFSIQQLKWMINGPKKTLSVVSIKESYIMAIVTIILILMIGYVIAQCIS